MKIVYLTAGAAGMYCGSCMLDNALAKALIRLGHDCILVPLYTPIRTDEEDVSLDQVFFGGINVFLQQKMPWLRWLPKWLDSPLNNSALVKRLTANTGKTSAKLLGQLTVSMLAGIEGNQRKEVVRLCDWLVKDIQPDCVIFTNLMIAGMVPELRRRIKSSLWVVLQGDDIFLDSLPEPYQQLSLDKMRGLVPLIDGFIVHSQDYANRMGERLGIPTEKLHIVPLGIDTAAFVSTTSPLDNASSIVKRPLDSNEFRIGYFARLAPEKGLHRLVEAFILLANQAEFLDLHLHIAGYLGPQNIGYWQTLQERLIQAGLANRFTYHGSVDRDAKIAFLRSIDLLCVPTEYAEPKGLFVLEAIAARTPYLLPNHGAFYELHERLNFGKLFKAKDQEDLVLQLGQYVVELRSAEMTNPIMSDDHALKLAEIDIHEMAKRKYAVLSSTLAVDEIDDR